MFIDKYLEYSPVTQRNINTIDQHRLWPWELCRVINLYKGYGIGQEFSLFGMVIGRTNGYSFHFEFCREWQENVDYKTGWADMSLALFLGETLPSIDRSFYGQGCKTAFDMFEQRVQEAIDQRDGFTYGMNNFINGQFDLNTEQYSEFFVMGVDKARQEYEQW